jgi:hypothetical protein
MSINQEVPVRNAEVAATIVMLNLMYVSPTWHFDENKLTVDEFIFFHAKPRGFRKGP